MTATQLQELFSANLKEMRLRKNMSQMKLAEKADLSVGYICDLESGRRWGTPETFSKLALSLEVSPFELLLPKAAKNTSPTPAEIAYRHSLAEKLSAAIQKKPARHAEQRNYTGPCRIRKLNQKTKTSKVFFQASSPIHPGTSRKQLLP